MFELGAIFTVLASYAFADDSLLISHNKLQVQPSSEDGEFPNEIMNPKRKARYVRSQRGWRVYANLN